MVTQAKAEGGSVVKAFIVVSLEGTDGAGSAMLGLANLNNFNRLWGIGAAPSCLVPGPGYQITAGR